MMSFNEYWKEKAAKRRKSWVSKAKRFADQHTQLEDIRKEVYLPLDYGVNFSFEDYKPVHFIKKNPIVCWQDLNFCFSEDGLRAALEAERLRERQRVGASAGMGELCSGMGADMSSFRMDVCQQTIKGKEAPQPMNRWEQYPIGTMPNKAYDYERQFHAWLKRMYEICIDVETVHLSYGQITMTIKRYSTEGMPFGYYELNPCEQLTKSAMLLQETDFYTLNIATLLMESAAEWELRQEELNYYAKKLKLRTMEAATTDSIEFELWDDKKLQKKIQEYIGKDYKFEKILEQVLRPWKLAIKKYIDAATERTLKEQVQTFEHFDRYNSTFAEKVFVPYLNSFGMQDMKTQVSEDKMRITIMSEGFLCSIINAYDGIHLYPNSYYEGCQMELLPKTPLSAIGEYLKMMPRLSQKMEETMVKTLHIYDQQMLHDDEYRTAVEYLDDLAKPYAGKPVGKMMKYIRWRAEDFLRRPRMYWTFPISTIKILSDRAFSYQFEGKNIERWLDAECHTIYASDPVIEDVKARETALSPVGVKRKELWSMTIDDFVHWFISRGFLSIDFIDQKL